MIKLVTAVSVAALLGVGSVAYAQDAGVTVDAGAGAETPAGDVGADANVDASASSNAGGMSDNTYGSVMSSISGSAEVDLSSVTDEADITIVLLSSLQGNADTEAAALDEALAADAEGQTTLHGNIEGNAAITAKLEAEGYAATDVVAVKSDTDGSVILYVDDRA